MEKQAKCEKRKCNKADLFTAVRKLDKHAILRYLATEDPIDFSSGSSSEPYLLTYVAERFSEDDAAEILRAMVLHIERHPQDKIDWGKLNCGQEFMESAADSARLSLLYPIVKHMPYYGDRTVPIALKQVWRWDWEALEASEKEDFSIDDAFIIEASKVTWELYVLSCWMPDEIIDEETIWRLVREGADILFDYAEEGEILLTTMCCYCPFSCLMGVLEAHKRPLLIVPGWSVKEMRDYVEDSLSFNDDVSEERTLIFMSALDDQMKQYPPVAGPKNYSRPEDRME